MWNAYTEREKVLPDHTPEKGSEVMRQIERSVYLRSLDALWMEHIDNMAHLREGVALRGYGQKDPLIEYKQEGFQMFVDLLNLIRTNTVNTLFKLEFRQEGAPQIVREAAPAQLVTNEDQIEEGLSGGGNPAIMRKGQRAAALPSHPEIGRNDACFCGSGKKFKKCHGAA